MDNKVKILKKFKGGSMAETFLIEKGKEHSVRKIVNNDGDSLGMIKLKKQWEWLYNFNIKNVGLIPEVGFFVIDNASGKAYYDMEYLHMVTLRDVFLDELEIQPGYLQGLVNCAAMIAGDKTIPTNPSILRDYIKVNHLDKMYERTRCIKDQPFYRPHTLIINGRNYHSLLTLLDKIDQDKDLLNILTPLGFVRSHGDFTFQNVLTDSKHLKVIDPRGEGPDSIYYDISKIFQSCHGKYDLMYEGNYEVDTGVHTQGVSEIPFINYRIKDHVEKFDEAYKHILNLIPEFYKNLSPHWEMITKFYEASHFISMAPFRLKENLEITAMCYAKGIELLTEVLEGWRNK